MKKRNPPPIPLEQLNRNSRLGETAIEVAKSETADVLVPVEPAMTPSKNSNSMGGQLIPIARIRESRYQNRIFNQEADEFIAELAENIDNGELNSPILVRALPDGWYELIAGEHRVEAFKLNGQESIPAIVKELGDIEAAKATVLDNVFHKPTSAFELFRGFKTLMDVGAYSSQGKLAKAVNLSSSEISRLFQFAKFPAVALEKLMDKPSAIGSNTADQLAAFCESNPDLVIEAVSKVVDGDLDQSRAVGWVRSKIAPKVTVESRIVTNAAGKTVFSVSSEKNSVQVKIHKQNVSAEVEQLIFDLLESRKDSL